MKAKLTLKSMLLATLCCILISAVDLLCGSDRISPRDFRTLIYWIIVAIGWIVFIWEQFHKTK